MRRPIEPVDELAKKPLPEQTKLSKFYAEMPKSGDSGIRMKAKEGPRPMVDFSVPWRKAAKEAMRSFDMASEELEKRFYLVKLANFISEAEYPPGEPKPRSLAEMLENILPKAGGIREWGYVVKEAEKILASGWSVRKDVPVSTHPEEAQDEGDEYNPF